MRFTLVDNLLFFHYSLPPLRTGLSDLKVAFRLGIRLNRITATIRAAMYSISDLNKLDGFTHLGELVPQKTLLYEINVLLNEAT